MRVTSAEAKCKASEAAATTASKRVRDVEAELSRLLGSKRPDLGESVQQFLDKKLRGLRQDTNLFETHRQALQAAVKAATAPRRSAFELARQRLLQSGLASDSEGGRILWHLTRDPGKPGEPLPLLERQAVEGFNSALLAELVFPGALVWSAEPNYVDHQLYSSKLWRDVYQYDDRGNLTGWTRHAGRHVTDFTESGLLVLERDEANRPHKVRSVRYVATPAEAHGRPSTLEVVAGDEVITYSYDTGKRVETSRTRVNGK